MLYVTVKNIDADSLCYLRCMVKRHRKNTLFLNQHLSFEKKIVFATVPNT